MIHTKITVGGVTHNDYQTMRISKAISDYNSSSDYTIIYDSPFGRHDNDFTVGNEIIIYADNIDASTILFKGILETIKFVGKGVQQKVELRGRDYSLRLQDVTVEPVVYTNSEVSTIVKNIISSNVTEDITVNNVNTTTTTLDRISFNHESIFDALTQLGKLAGFIFYVDSDKDLHFEQRENVDSGIDLDNTNIYSCIFNETREGMANSIWVYGDRALTGIREELTLNGSPWGGRSGSEYILTYKPHTTEVEYLNNVKKGGVFGMAVVSTSGPDYLVNFHDRKLIFQSGTEIGYDAVPISGGSVIVNYNREVPIVKMGEDKDSITIYGKKVKVINDKSIKDPILAMDLVKKELEDSSPFKGLEIGYKGWLDIIVGQTVDITLSDFGLSETVGILSVDYKFDKNTVQSQKVIKFRLDKKVKDITDEITDLRKRLGYIESQDRQSSDIITRLEQAAGSLVIVGSYWEVKTRTTGSSFILGQIGTQTNPHAGGRLGSIIGSGINFLGDSRTAFSVQTSGGYNY